MTIGKQELARKIAYRHNMSQKKAEVLISAIFKTITEGLQKDGIVRISPFGIFITKERTARTGVNPQNMKKIVVPAMFNTMKMFY